MNQLSSGHIHLPQMGHSFFFSCDWSLVPLTTPPRPLNVKSESWWKEKIFGGLFTYWFFETPCQRAPFTLKVGPKKGPFEQLDVESWNSQSVVFEIIILTKLGGLSEGGTPKIVPK